MTKRDVEEKINTLLHEKFFAGMRKIIVEQQKRKFLATTEFKKATDKEKKVLLDYNYKNWFDSISNFFLSYKSIYALKPLVIRELEIRKFVSQEIIRVKVDYSYNDLEFSVFYPTQYTEGMIKEVEDCISELKNEKYTHIVENYISKTDTERSPHVPLTTAELKYSAFYLFNFDPEYVTYLAQKLYAANLITDPETNGWLIENSIAEDMITVLNQKFDESKVLQYKRVYSDNNTDRETQECIRPITITSKYFPKNIKNTIEFSLMKTESNKEFDDLIKLYEFIFYITLSTQMKNSIYDTSSIEVIVGNKLLIEQSYILIEGQDNWELLSGQMMKRISSNDSMNKKYTVVLPEIEAGTVLKPLNISSYSYASKRPRRYGIGRFLTQILEKKGIGVNKEHDEIVNELIKSKSLHLIKTMLHPQENAVILIEWILEYMPILLDKEYFLELNEKIEAVVDNEIPLQSLIDEINRIIETGFANSGFKFDDVKPSQAKINLIKRVAKENNLNLDESILSSNVKIDMILAKYPAEEPIKIGSCPSCNSLVFQKKYINNNTGEVSYYFVCEKFNKNGGCSFVMWDNYIYKFFSDKSIELFNIEDRAECLKKILSKKKGYLFNDFIAKNQKPYDAKVLTHSYTDKKTDSLKWGFDLVFVNKRKG